MINLFETSKSLITVLNDLNKSHLTSFLLI